MAFLGIFGGNACGKTTATTQMWEDLGKFIIPPDGAAPITFIHADNNNAEYRYDNGVKTVIPRTKGRSPWKQDIATKRAQVTACIDDDTRVYVVESGRFDLHSAIAEAYVANGGGAHIVFGTMTAAIMQTFMMARCEKRNKVFRADYWTPAKFLYEGYKRYINGALRYLDPVGVPWTAFTVDLERRVWDDIQDFAWGLLERSIDEWYE